MENKDRPLVLVVAGLDSGGGAGITADCLTIFDNAAFALPCTSALTCQSLKNITKVTPTDEETFKETLDIAFRDWDKISAIKVGLISDVNLLKIFLSYLDTKFKDIPVVWDPVLCGTAGDLRSVNLKDFLSVILPHVTIFTPNIPEALTLAGWTKEDFESNSIEKLGHIFTNMGAKSVIIKGGHNISTLDATDTFISNDLTFTMQNQRVEGEGAHGGGCALSSALAALLANGFAPHDAAVIAKAYVYQGIKESALTPGNNRPPIGHNGFVQDLKFMPLVKETGFPSKNDGFLPCPIKLGLYPVVDSVEWIKHLVKLGVRTIQLRIKDKSDPLLFEKIKEAVKFCNENKARLFIDDHYKLAIEAHAYGVHLGMEDLRDADIEQIRKAGLRLGVSTHGAYEMLKARQLKPSYIALGHIFPTQSKVMPSKPQGVFKLFVEQRMIKDSISTVAIGGIKLHNVQSVVNTGVGSVALITGITKSENPDETTKQWLSICGNGNDLE